MSDFKFHTAETAPAESKPILKVQLNKWGLSRASMR